MSRNDLTRNQQQWLVHIEACASWGETLKGCKRSANRVCQECRNFVEVAPVTQTGEDGDE